MPIEIWHKTSDYVQGIQKIHNLRVVNDTTERDVKLFEAYNRLLTKIQEEKQIILHIVEHNQKIVSTQPKKTSLVDTIKNTNN